MLIELTYIECDESLPAMVVDRGIAAQWHNLVWGHLVETHNLLKQCLSSALNKPENLFESKEIIRTADGHAYAGAIIYLNSDCALDEATYLIVDVVISEVSCRIFDEEGKNISLLEPHSEDQALIDLLGDYADNFLRNQRTSKSRKPIKLGTKNFCRTFSGRLVRLPDPTPQSERRTVNGRVVSLDTISRTVGIQSNETNSVLPIRYDEKYHFIKLKNILGELQIGTFDVIAIESRGKVTLEICDFVSITQADDALM